MRFDRKRAGFTLIEMLAVLLILSILSYFLLVNLGGATTTTEIGIAKTKLQHVKTMLDQMSDDRGEFPSSQLPADLGTATNSLNVGSECLYLALCAEGSPGAGTIDQEKDLCNSDRDVLSKRPKGFEKQDLYELADPWGNPIAYIRNSDYEKEFHYICVVKETGEEEEFSVRALKNPATGRYQEPHGFQLISAGPDGKFGFGDDDIANFSIAK
ncbi:MAG TPA: type II secretion system protein [Planctomycetota bacterium]|nr:type II secretion system protein [Planctomycetota bacterium]